MLSDTVEAVRLRAIEPWMEDRVPLISMTVAVLRPGGCAAHQGGQRGYGQGNAGGPNQMGGCIPVHV